MQHLRNLTRSWSLRSRLMVALLGAEAIIFGVLFAVTTQRARQAAHQAAIDDATLTAHALAAASRDMLLDRDEAGLQELVAEVTEFGSIEYAAVQNAEGQIVADSRTQAADRALVADERFGMDLPDGVFDLLYPIQQDGETVGYVWVGISTASAAREIRPQIGIQGAALAATFAATMVISALLVRAATRRLVEMTDQVQRQTAGGHLSLSLPVEADDEVSRLAAAFNQISAAYRQSLQNLARRADDLAVLNMLAATISQTLDLQEVLNISLRQALAAVDWELGAIYMWDERTATLNLVSFVGLSEDYVRETITYELGEGITGRAAQERTIKIVEDLWADPQARQFPGSSEVAAQISIPLTVPDRLLGVMNLNSREPRTPTSSELEWLTTIAHQIAVALDKAQLHYELSQHAEELEGIVAERTEELAQVIEELSVALERAREADQFKSRLLSIVSHELRTPLAAIKGHTSMLVDHYQHITPGTLLEFLLDIEEESDKLTELIGNLLEMSRIEAGVLQIQSQAIDLVEVVRGAVEAAQVRITHHPIRLESPEQRPTAFADARRIQQILDNLLDNAAKYSRDGRPIIVRVQTVGDVIQIGVEDQGCGIAPAHLERIFEHFYQVRDDSKPHGGGIGLGLAICRGLVEAHGGRIWVESRVGVGSTFYFTVPVHTGSDEAEELGATRPGDA
jgi:signal transduction histidine kinase/HAMP domain-containing protein